MMRIKRLTQAVAFATVLGAAGAMPAYAESTNSVTFEGWANDTAVRYNGRIPRDIYLDEMGRRWDADAGHRGTRELYLIELRGRWDGSGRGTSGLTRGEM